MIALTWRQHRVQLLAAAAVILAFSGYLLVTGHQMTSYMSSIGLDTCLSHHGNCQTLAVGFLGQFGNAANPFSLIDLLPLLAGLFWGAPLVAREIERGTHRLAWTQSVSRQRWLTAKLAAFIGTAVLAAAVVALLLAWWLRPFDRLIAIGAGGHINRMTPGVFDLSGTVPAAYMLFAFALGTAAGALIRRTVPAMAVTLAGYIAVWLPLESVRYRFIAPLTARGPYGASAPPVPLSAYVLANANTAAAGHPVSFAAMVAACHSSHGGETGVRLSCLAAKGFQYATTYQPDSRFWAIQGIETGILAGAAAVLLGAAAWWTTRHVT